MEFVLPLPRLRAVAWSYFPCAQQSDGKARKTDKKENFIGHLLVSFTETEMG